MFNMNNFEPVFIIFVTWCYLIFCVLPLSAPPGDVCFDLMFLGWFVRKFGSRRNAKRCDDFRNELDFFVQLNDRQVRVEGFPVHPSGSNTKQKNIYFSFRFEIGMIWKTDFLKYIWFENKNILFSINIYLVFSLVNAAFSIITSNQIQYYAKSSV